jgi:hypothetical protein
LHFELWNCGNNVPQAGNNSVAIVAQQFDMRPNPATGVISVSTFGKPQFLYGESNRTQVVVGVDGKAAS